MTREIRWEARQTRAGQLRAPKPPFACLAALPPLS